MYGGDEIIVHGLRNVIAVQRHFQGGRIVTGLSVKEVFGDGQVRPC